MVEGALKLMTNSSDFTKKHEILTPEQQFVSRFLLSNFLDLFVLKKVYKLKKRYTEKKREKRKTTKDNIQKLQFLLNNCNESFLNKKNFINTGL